MNANLIHKWLRDPRFSPNATDDNPVPSEATTFLPVEIEGVASAPTTPSMAYPLSAHRVSLLRSYLCAENMTSASWYEKSLKVDEAVKKSIPKGVRKSYG